MARIITFFRQPTHRKVLAFEAFLALQGAWMLVRLRPFRSYDSRLGLAQSGEVRDTNAHNIELLKDIRWAVTSVNQSFGDPFTCLMQAMAAKSLLNRRGLSNTLVLGAKLDLTEDVQSGCALAAHAWLWSGNKLIVGGEERPEYQPVTSYSSG